MSDNTTSWKDDKIKQLHAELDKAINELSGSITVNNLKDKEIERMKVFAVSVEKAKDKEIKRLKDLLREVPELMGEYDDIHNCMGKHCIICRINEALAAQPQKGELP